MIVCSLLHFAVRCDIIKQTVDKVGKERLTMCEDTQKNGGQTAHTKYNFFDENGMLVFRYNKNSFSPSDAPIGSYTYPVLKIAVVTAGEADWRFRKTVYHARPGDIAILRSGVPRSIDRIAADRNFECDM